MIVRIYEQTIPYKPWIIKPRINIYLGTLPNLSWLIYTISVPDPGGVQKVQMHPLQKIQKMSF
mgnify:CR=1 FL=1